MPVIIANEILLSPELQEQPLNNARIGWNTITRTGTPSASSSANNSLVLAPANGLTYQFWQPVSLPAWWQIDNGSPIEIDYVGIAAHEFGSNGNLIEIQYSDDEDTWTTVADANPNDNRPLMFLFEAVTARYWRVLIDSGTAPRVGVIYVGKVLQMQRAIYGGHSPITLSRDTEIRPNTSEGGQWLGRSIIRDGVSTSFNWSNLKAAWYRSNFDPFVKSARRFPFFIAWRPLKYPNEIGYVWTSGDITPQNSGTKDYMDVSLPVSGLAGYE